jgi:hypothetical protein
MPVRPLPADWPPRVLDARRARRLAVQIVYVVVAIGLLASMIVVPVLPLPAPQKVCATDVLQAKAVAGLANYANWLRRNGAAGFIGEVGWPSDRDSRQWNALADTWYTAADHIGLPVTAWAAGSWPADYPQTVYRSVKGAPEAGPARPQAAVVERHPSTDRYLRGVNLAFGSFAATDSSGAFGGGNPGRYGEEYGYETPAAYHSLADHGVRLIRLAVSWERLQPVPNGPLSRVELARVRAALDWAHDAHLDVVLDLHGYGEFAIGGGLYGPVRRMRLGSPELPIAALADFWRRMTAAVADRPAVVALGILNEPTHLAADGRAGALIWERAAQQSVDAIRRTGSTTALMISGYLPIGPWAWGMMHPHAWVNDPLDRIAYEAHAYFDSDSSGKYYDSYANEVRRVANPVPSLCQWVAPVPAQALPTG